MTTSFAQEPAQKPAQPAAPDQVTQATTTVTSGAKAAGQRLQFYSDQNYAKGQSQWPKFWSVWSVRDQLPSPNFTNSPLIDRVIRDGKMYLSLDDAVALALENNLDIAIQRYNLITADADILRTSSGAAALGVNTGLVQGTPGGPPGSTTQAELAPLPQARREAAQAAPRIGVGGAARAQRALLPRPRAKARRLTISIRSSLAPARNNTRSRRPPIFSLAPRR